YLDGDWSIHRSHINMGNSEGGSGGLTVLYQGKEVNAVLEPSGEKNFQVFLTQNGKNLGKENSGNDVFTDGEGRTFIRVDKARLYNLVKNREYGEHTLNLTSRSNGLAVFSLSFVSSIIPEMIS
ncbi:MAG TPA: hypothetical protein VJO14_04680, partial [Bacteroidota bacterium]|nr:hypothetical protein [Bacteroidota bacterium]